MMRKAFSDGRIIAILCAALVVEVALLLWHLRLNTNADQDHAEGARRAGQVIAARNQLRRRGLNSLVWEASQANEAVYFHDSILTLQGSEARIQLAGGTEISVSENTLVTIEPPEDQQSGEIRLKFVRGNLRARNPFLQAQVGTEQLAIQIKPGSDVDLRQVNDGQFELRVQKGDAQIINVDGGKIAAGQGEFLRLEQDQVQRLRVDNELTWMEPPPARIYSHGTEVPVRLGWKGSAGKLVVQSVGRGEHSVEIGQTSTYQLHLALGQHRLLLRDGERTSLPLDIQVLKAPLIHLLSPLPRDRAQLEERILFQWMQVPGISAHELRVEGQKVQLRERVNGSEHVLTFSQEADFEWSVQGLDEDGFAVPPLYTYPLYLRSNPLAPPKLKSPSLRRPAAKEDQRGAFWQRVQDVLFPRAFADDAPAYEASFSWETVSGADQYVIEISESPDFRNPLVAKTIRRNEFVWKGFALKPYYWRVAAGSRSGRMGVFSEPALVNLQDSASAQGSIDGVVVRQAKQKEVKKSEVPANPPPAEEKAYTSSPIKDERVEEPKPLPVTDARMQRRALFVEPGVRYLNADAAEGVRAKLNGFTPIAARAEWPVALAPERSIRIDLAYESFQFEPKPRDEYPFQEDITWSRTSAGLLWFDQTRRWGYGIGLGQRVKIERSDYESVRTQTPWALGPRIESSWVTGRLATIVRGGFYLSSGALGGEAGVEVRYPIWRAVHLGAGLEAQFFTGSSETTSSGDLHLALGFEF